jgi:GDPmannose 4,6-dehydratase
MWRMLQQDEPDDFVVATGESNTLESFVEQAFAVHDLDWREHVDVSSELYRPTDLQFSQGCPGKVAARLGWSAQYHMRDVVRLMCAT